MLNFSLCLEARELISDSKILIIHFTVIFLNLTGFLAVLNVVKLLITVKTFHINTRVLYGNLIFCMILRTLIMTYRSGRLVFAGYFFKDDCQLLQDEHSCMIQSNIGTLPLAGFTKGFAAVCIERLIATIKFKSYHKSKEPYIGICLLGVTWICSVYPVLNTYFEFNFDKQNYVSYCSSKVVDLKPLDFDFIYSQRMIAPYFCIFTSIITYGICYYRKRSFINYTLSNRYTLDDILRTTQFILPACITFCLLYITSALSYYFFIHSETQFTMKDNVIAKELNSLLIMPIYINIFPWMCIFTYSTFLRKTFTCNILKKWVHKKGTKVSPLGNGNDYFEIYKSIWQ